MTYAWFTNLRKGHNWSPWGRSYLAPSCKAVGYKQKKTGGPWSWYILLVVLDELQWSIYYFQHVPAVYWSLKTHWLNCGNSEIQLFKIMVMLRNIPHEHHLIYDLWLRKGFKMISLDALTSQVQCFFNSTIYPHVSLCMCIYIQYIAVHCSTLQSP